MESRALPLHWVKVEYTSTYFPTHYCLQSFAFFKDWSLGLLAHISRDSLVRDWYLIELQSNFNLQVSLV